MTNIFGEVYHNMSGWFIIEISESSFVRAFYTKLHTSQRSDQNIADLALISNLNTELFYYQTLSGTANDHPSNLSAMFKFSGI